jgi:winged helix domain-containing protein/ATPase family protein associated with various cellular activities (AAA)
MEDPTVAASSVEQEASKHDRAANPHFAALLPGLRRLDRLLDWAMEALPPGRRRDASAPFRGLILSREDVTSLLAQEPGETPFGSTQKFAGDYPGELTQADSPLAWLIHSFGLCSFDADLVLLSLAPEVDLRYEKIFAFLQDDVTRKRPTIELALNLLCTSAEEKLNRRLHFSPSSPLLRHGLLQIVPDPNQVEPPYLAHYLKLDDQVVRLLLGQLGLDARLAPYCRILEPAGSLDDMELSPVLKKALPLILGRAQGRNESLRLYVRAPQRARREDVATALAVHLGTDLLSLDLARAVSGGEKFEEILRIFLREARFRNAIPFLDGLDALYVPERVLHLESLLGALAAEVGLTILAGSHHWVSSPHGPTGVIEVPLGNPDFAGRRDRWQACLDALETSVGDGDLQVVADRFRLDSTQIAEAAATARNFALLRAATEEGDVDATSSPTLSELFAAARAQSGHDLAASARKIEPKYTWADIVLPETTATQLREVCSRVAHRHRVLGEWGFDRKLSQGKAVNALFAGPSGCGKTMAAEVIANELQLDLYKIDLAGVVSKYIGETEKNLDRIFKAAENANAILFFDEADALFGKRSEVRDSHDRYANIEVSYLLQKMEEYDGIAILASNMRHHMDESFLRRLAFVVLFPFPDEADRTRIWERIWPRETPLAEDLNLAYHANRFKLSGGNIKNVALAAAFLAASDGGVVTMTHLFRATEREYQKMGKAMSEAELCSAYEEEKGKNRAVVGAH